MFLKAEKTKGVLTGEGDGLDKDAETDTAFHVFSEQGTGSFGEWDELSLGKLRE